MKRVAVHRRREAPRSPSRAGQGRARGPAWSGPLTVLLLTLLSACGEEDGPAAAPPAIVGRVYDFITHLDQAEVIADEFYRPDRKVWGDRFRNTDDEDFHALVLPNLTLRFRDVEVLPGATLDYGFGPNKVEVEPARGKVRFRILIGPDGEEQPFVEQSLNPAGGLRAPVRSQLDLSAMVGQRVNFLFETSSPDPDANTWPAWHRLRLTSDGRPATEAERFLQLTELSVDLLEQLDQAEVMEQREGTPITRTAFSGDAAEGSGGPVLLANPPSAVRFDVVLPEHAVLDFSAVVRGHGPEPGTAGEVRFVVDVNGRVVHEQAARAAADGGLQRSHTRVDLASDAGPVSLTLRTTAAANRTVEAGWVFPQILERRQVARARHDPRQPSVLMIVVDTLRADHLGCYGAARATSPNLDALAAESILFENMLAPSSWTLPSTASLLTGLYPLSHGVLSERLTYLDDRVTTLAERLVEEGFSTAAFAGNLLISTQSNFQQGFETFQCQSWPNARKLNRRFLDWLDDHSGDRFFAYLHHIDPHDPYAAPPPFTEHFSSPGNRYAGKTDQQTLAEVGGLMQDGIDWDAPEIPEAIQHLRDLYDSEIYYWDAQLGVLLEELAKRDRLDSTILVITSDHGEEFLEHRMIFHAQQLYQESIHVPLLIRDARRPAARLAQPVQSVDLVPTLLALLGLEPADDVQGEDVFAVEEGRAQYSSTELGKIEGREERVLKNSVLWRGWKLITVPLLDHAELYFLGEDPAEERDLMALEPDKAAALQGRIEQWIEDTFRDDAAHLQDFDAATRERMREMGYIDR